VVGLCRDPIVPLALGARKGISFFFFFVACPLVRGKEEAYRLTASLRTLRVWLARATKPDLITRQPLTSPGKVVNYLIFARTRRRRGGPKAAKWQ